jgi:hypothetical protein
MAGKRFGIVVLITVAMLAVNAAAQKNEISGSIGRFFIADQGVPGTGLADSNIHFGDALSYEVNYGRRFMDIGVASLTVEVPFVFSFNQGVHFELNEVPKNFNSYFVTPSARVNLFPTTGFSPWISAGGGFGHFSENSTLEYGGTNPGASGTTTGVFQAGIGLDVRLLRSVKLRGEVRDFYSGTPQLNINTETKQHNLFAGVGLSWSF